MKHRASRPGDPRFAGTMDTATAQAKAFGVLPIAFVAMSSTVDDEIVVLAQTEAEFIVAATEAFRHDIFGRIRVEPLDSAHKLDLASVEAAVANGKAVGYPLQVIPQRPIQGAAMTIVAHNRRELIDAARRALEVSAPGLICIRKIKSKLRGGR